MRKVLSVWKVILIILASFAGVGGATTLGLYLTGSFNKVVVEPADMKFSREIDGEGFYNEDKSAYELSADSKLTITCTTEGVTEKEITLSLRNGTERNGYITDGVITIPKIVEFNKPFEVQLVKTYNENIYQNWIKGGTSYITAKSSNVNLTAQYATISVDVPVYEIDLKVSGTEKTAEEKETNTQTVVVDSVFTLDTAFTPVESRYFYNDTERERGIYFSVTGRNAISYDETTKRFTALKVSDSGEESVVTAYVFANAFFERKYFEAHPEATSDEIVAYLSSRVGTEAVSTRLNLLVESVDVQEVDFTLNGGSVLAYVDKEYMITLNSNNGDKSLGVVVKDADGNVLTDLYGQVGIRIPQGVSNMTILGGRIVVEDADGIRYEDYNSATDYFNAPEGTIYYILPNTAPSNANNYFWTFTSTDDVDATEMFVNFFFEKDGERTKFFATDEEKSFVLTIAKHADLAVGWVEPEKSISLKINYNEQGEPISASEDLSRLIKQVDASNVYKTIKYFLFAEENDIDLTEAFVCEAGKSYTVDYNGERFVVDNEPTTRESYTLFELRGSTLTAKRSFNGTAKVIAAIIRTNENGEPYYDADGKYLVVAAGRSKEIVVESSLSIANMEATYSFAEGITPADDGKYYIPSERKTTEGSDEVMLTLQFTLRSDDIENDVNKIPAAFTNNKLRVVCLDENGYESEKQYLSLANLVEDEEQRTAISAVFNGRFYVNPETVTAFDVDGIPVKLQLQYEEFSKEILRAETEDEDTFYVYYQKPTTLKGKYEDDAESYPVYEDEGAHISVSIKTPEEGQEAGIEIYWQEQSIEEGEPVWVNGTQIDGLSALQALFEYTMADSKGKEVRPQDGLYRFYFAELDNEGNIKTTDNVLSFNGDSTALVSINSTNGNTVTTKMRVFVKDQNNTDLLQSALFTLTVKSDGLENVKVDSRIAPHNEGNPAEEDYWDYNSGNWGTESPWKETGIRQSLGEITTRKLVTKDSVINIDSLFKIYTTGATDSGVASTTYTVKLDATFVGGLRGKQSSVELMKMMRFNEDASVEGLAIENYYDGYYMDGDNRVDLGTDIRKITIIAPFNRDGATLTFTVMDNSGLYLLRLNVELVSNIATTNNFRSYMQEEGSTWHDYYKQSPDNPNAISVLAGKVYDLDTYLSFAEGSGFSWSTAKLTDETFSETSGIIQYVANTGKIKVKDVYQDTNVTFTVHYMSSSTYAYSITVALYLIPNFKLVTKDDTFVDLERIVNGDTSDDYEMKDFFDIQRIDNTDESSLPVLGTFNYINTSANKYLRVEGGVFKLEQSATVFEYNFGQNYSQDFAIQYSQQSGGTEVLVDMAIVANGGDIIVAERGQTKLSFVMGYYNSNVQEMLKEIIPDAKVVTYNGSLYLLLLTGTTYQMNGFSIYKNEQTGEVGVRPMGYISSTNLQAISTLGSVEGFLSDQEYAIIQRTLSGEFVLRMRLNAIVTSVGEIFANYENNPEDLAVLIGDYTALQDNNVEQALIAGEEYDVVHFRKDVNYKLTQDENIDWTKTYYNSSFEAVTFYYFDVDEYKPTADAVEGVDTYYIKNGDSNFEVVTAGILASLYEHDEAYGFFIDPAKYVENEYLTANLSIVESARGYIAGLAELDGNKLIIHELANDRTDVYVVLCLTLSDIYSGAEYKWYYRILVVGSFDVGEVFYPYAKESEYLEATSEYYNVVDQANGIVDPSGDRVYKYYEINLEEEFDNKTMVPNHKRFEFDETGVEARTEVLSVVLVGDTSSTALLPTSYTADGKDYLVYGQYLLINIDDNVLKIYLKDSTSKYIVKLRRSYYKEGSLMKGAELDYTFKINHSPNYDFEAKKVKEYKQVTFYYYNGDELKETNEEVDGVEQYYVRLQGSQNLQVVNSTIMKGLYVVDDDNYVLTQDTAINWTHTYFDKYSEDITLRGNIFTMTAVAGSAEVVIDAKVGEHLGAGTDWNVPYAVYVVGEEGFIKPNSFSYDRDAKQIRFTPKEKVARNGSFEIGFFEVEYDGAGEKYAVDTSLVVFKIVVNVESFYKYQVLKTEVESGAKTKFSDIFYIYDSNAGYGLTEDDTINWSKTYFEKVGENYNAIKFYYKDGESTYKETSTAVTGKKLYVQFNGDSAYTEVTADLMQERLYEYQPDLSMKSKVKIDNGADVYAYVKTTDNDIVWDKEYYLFSNNEYTKIDKIYYYAEITEPTAIDIDVAKVFFIKNGESYIEMTPENISTYLYVEVDGQMVSCGDERIDLGKTYYIDNAGNQEAVFYYRCPNESDEKIDGLTYLYEDGSTYYEFAGAGIRRLYERLTIDDIAKVDGTNHIIDHAYVSNNTTLKLTATYGGFNFSFDLTLIAKNPYTTTRFTDEIIRYGKVEYDLTIEHLRDHAANKNSMFDDDGTYKFVTEKDDEISLSDSVKIVPKDYAEAHIETVRYKIAYLFGGNYISDFIVEYNYTIYPNIEILVNYPDPDDNKTVSTEYYQSGVTGEISFDQQALFGKAARILTNDIALEFVELTAEYIPENLYEKSGDNYNKTSDTEINTEKTYYVNNGAEYKVADIRYYNGKYYLAEKAQGFDKDWKVEISNIADVSVVVGATSYAELSGDEIGSDTKFSLVLNQGKTSGTITFKVTINSIVVYYTFNVINHEVFTTETNETNYALVDETNQAEYIYAEDLAGYASQDLFENNRILGYAFNSNATIGQTYYVRMTLKGSTAYRIVAIRASSLGRLNTDMGSAAENYEFTRAYTDLSYAQAGTNEGVADGIFSTVPFVTSRIVFKYGDGTNTTEIKNSSAWVGKGDTQFTGLQKNDYKNTENTLGYTIKLKVNEDEIGVSSKNYSLYLTSEFVVNGSADSRDSYVIGEVNAGSSVSLFNDLAAYGIVNSRLGVAYSDSVMMQSNGNIDLDILGFADTLIPTTVDSNSSDAEIELNWFYRQFGLTPRANGFTINGTKTSDLTYNYVTLSANKGGTEDGKIRDYFIRAQGAKNEGNYIMLKITYTVTFDGKTIEESHNLLLKVNPASTIYFNGTSRVAGTETLDGDVWATNKSDPIVVNNDTTSNQNKLSLYHATDKTDVTAAKNAVVAYLYGNTGSGGNNLQDSIVGFTPIVYAAGKQTHDGIEYNKYNSDGTVTTHVDTNKFIMPSLQIGTENYYINLENKFGYKIRLYVRLVGNVIPTLDMTDVISEGEKIYFGTSYTNVDVSNSGLQVTYNNTKYQMFTNAEKSDGTAATMRDKLSNLLPAPVGEGNLKVGEDEIIISKVLFVLSNVSGLYINPTNSENGWISYSGDVYGNNDVYWTTSSSTQKVYVKEEGTSTYNEFIPGSDTEYQFKIGYEWSGDSKLNDIIWTKDGDNILYPTYTAGAQVTPEAPTGGGVLATLGGFTANAFESSMGIISKKGIEKSSFGTSNLPNFTIKSVTFELNGETLYQEIGKQPTASCTIRTTGTPNNTIFSGKVKYVNSDYDAVDGIEFKEDAYVTVPYIDGFYFGKNQTLSNVTMIVTLKDTEGNTGTATKVITLKHDATIGSALTKGTKDGDPIEVTANASASTGVTSVLNDTLQVELDKGATVTFTLKKGQEGVAGAPITLTNDKGYKTTKYICITDNLKGLTQNLQSGDVIYITVTKNTGAVIKYNDDIKVGYKSTLSFNFEIAAAVEAMTMHIEDSSEVSSAAGYVSRQLYFIYTFRHAADIVRRYQAKPDNLTEVNIYPEYNSAYTNTTDTQGGYIIQADYYTVNAINRGPAEHYVVPFANWANSVKLQYRNTLTYYLSNQTPYKFIFEVNQTVEGGAGAGYINEYGNIILYPSFTVGVDTITINVYLKPTLVDGNYDASSGWLLGQFRISLNAEISGSPLSDYCLYQGYNQTSSETLADFTAKVNEEIELKDLFKETSGSNYHYHVIEDKYTPVGGDPETQYTTTQYRYDNRDTWKFTTAGTHKITVVKTWINGTSRVTKKITMTFFVYDESVGQEETVLIKGPDIYVQHSVNVYTVLDMNDLYEVAQTTDGTVDMTKTYYVEDGANYKKQEIYTYDFMLYDNTPSGNDNAYFRIVDSNNIPHYIPVSSEWIKHNLYEGDNNTLSTDEALVANKTYRYKTSSGFYSVARFYQKVFVPVSTKLGAAYLHRLEYLEISSDTQSYADTYRYGEAFGTVSARKPESGEWVVDGWYVYDTDSALGGYIKVSDIAAESSLKDLKTAIDPTIIYYSDSEGATKINIYYQRYSGTQNLAVADYYTSDTTSASEYTTVDMTELYEFTKTTDTYINWTQPYYFTIDGGKTYNLEIFYDKDDVAFEYNEIERKYDDGNGHHAIEVTYEIGTRSVIDGNKLTGSPAFNTSGKYSSYVINKLNGEFIKYTFYVYTGSVTEKYRKTSNEDFSMSNLASDVTAFWRIETSAAAMNGASVTLTRITKENTVTTDSTVYYLGLKTDGTYKIYGVEYTIVGNLSGKFGSIDKDDNVISTIEKMFGNPDNIASPISYTIYRVGKNGILQNVSEATDNVAGMIRRRMSEQNPGATDDEINALVAAEMSRTNLYEDEFVIIYNNKTYRTRFSLYFYEDAKTINYVTVEDVAFTLPTLNDIVLETVEKAGRVNYYNIEMTSGTLQEVLTITLDDLSYRATTYTYYIKVTTTSSEEFYYLITFNFFGVSKETEIIHMTEGNANYQLSTLDPTIKDFLGIAAEGTTLKYYSTENDLKVVVEGDKTYYELQTITTDSISFAGDETMVVKTYYIEETTTKTYYKATIRFVKESLTQITIINADIAGETNYRLNNLTNTLRSKAGTAGTITYYVKNGQTLSRVETITIEDRVELYIQIRAQGEQEITYTWRKVLLVTTEGSDVIEDPDAEIQGELGVDAKVNEANVTFDLTNSTFVESVKTVFNAKYTGKEASEVTFYSNDRGVLDPISQIELIGVTTEGITKGYYVKIKYTQAGEEKVEYYTCRIAFKLGE